MSYIASGQDCSILVDGGEISGDQTVCYGSKAALTSKSAPTFNSYDDSYSWTYKWQCSENNGELWESYDGNVSPPLFITNKSFIKTTQIRRRVTDNKGCIKYSNIITITVNPRPKMNDIPESATQTVSSGGKVNGVVFDTLVAGVRYEWEASGDWNKISFGAASGVGNFAGFTAKENKSDASYVATVRVRPKTGNCYGTAKKFTVTVNPKTKINDIQENRER
ncbi:MAG: hypothetical protein LBQ01_01280 [Prevotellaceae bacterium]|nr:hypothetical protein [Prevotellaceae bacterium]